MKIDVTPGGDTASIRLSLARRLAVFVLHSDGRAVVAEAAPLEFRRLLELAEERGDGELNDEALVLGMWLYLARSLAADGSALGPVEERRRAAWLCARVRETAPAYVPPGTDEVLAFASDDLPDSPALWKHLALLLSGPARWTPEHDLSIGLWRLWRVRARDRPDHAEGLFALGELLTNRHRARKQVGGSPPLGDPDMREAVSALDEALASPRLAPRLRSSSLQQRAMALTQQAGVYGEHLEVAPRNELGGGRLDVLDDALRAWRTYTPLAVPGTTERDQALAAQAQLWCARFVLRGADRDPEDLDRAVDLMKQMAQEAEGRSEALGWAWADLSHHLGIRAEERDRREDFDGAVDAADAAVRHSAEHPKVVVAALAAGHAYLFRSARYGVHAPEGDLEAAESAFRFAMATADRQGDTDSAALARGVLVTTLLEREQRLGGTGTAEALRLAEQAVEDSPPGPKRLQWQLNASAAWIAHHTATGEEDALTRAVELAQESVDGLAGEPLEASAHSRLAAAFAHRAEHTGSPGDLDGAVRAARRAVAAAGPASPDYPVYLHNLGTFLSTRFHRSRLRRDAEDAADAFLRLVQVTPDDSPRLPARLNGLWLALRAVPGQQGWSGLHAEGLRAAEKAVDRESDEHPFYPALLGNLGDALRERAEAGAGEDPVGDLDRAVRLTRKAVERTAPHDGSWASRVATFAQTLLARADGPTPGPPAGTGEPEGHADLLRADLLLSHAIANERDTHPARCQWLMLLARVRLRLAPTLVEETEEAEADHPLMRSVLGLFRQATEQESAPPAARATAAEHRGFLALGLAGGAEEAHVAYREALRLLRQAASVGLDRGSSRALLATWGTLAMDAAAAALADDDAEDALVLLESGRAVLWDQLLKLRDDLGEVRAVDRELADELENAAAVLQAGQEQTLPPPSELVPPKRGRRGITDELHTRLTLGAATTEERVAAGRRWTATVEKAKAVVPGFLAEPDARTLLAAGPPGPVVLVNTSRQRCDALVLEGGQLTTVGLPATATGIAEQADRYHSALAAFEARAQRSAGLGIGTTVPFARALLDVTRWLWQHITEPVLTHLGLNEPVTDDDRQRLWWCPTGPLVQLPLHAAGDHEAGPGPAVLDRVVSSYTPTLGALRRGRGPRGPRTDDCGPRMLAVIADDAPGQTSLRDGDRTRELLRGPWPEATVLRGKDATAQRVLSALPEHTHAHFLCHGRHDPSDPDGSGLELHDGTLTVQQLAACDQPDGAFLSLTACKTATADRRTADEAITPAAAFAYSGWRQTVATLWPVDEARTTELAAELYSGAAEDAAAGVPLTVFRLHDAVLRRRSEQGPRGIWAWAPYIHLGGDR